MIKIINVYEYSTGNTKIFAIQTTKTQKSIIKDWQKSKKVVQGKGIEKSEMDEVFKQFKRLGHKIVTDKHIYIDN